MRNLGATRWCVRTTATAAGSAWRQSHCETVVLKVSTPQYRCSQIFVSLHSPFQKSLTEKRIALRADCVNIKLKVYGYHVKVSPDGSKSKFLENKDLSEDLDLTFRHFLIPPTSNLKTPMGVLRQTLRTHVAKCPHFYSETAGTSRHVTCIHLCTRPRERLFLIRTQTGERLFLIVTQVRRATDVLISYGKTHTKWYA